MRRVIFDIVMIILIENIFKNLINELYRYLKKFFYPVQSEM